MHATSSAAFLSRQKDAPGLVHGTSLTTAAGGSAGKRARYLSP